MLLFIESVTSLVVSPTMTCRRGSFLSSSTLSGPMPKAETSMSPDLIAASVELGSGMKRKTTRSSLGSPFTQ